LPGVSRRRSPTLAASAPIFSMKYLQGDIHGGYWGWVRAGNGRGGAGRTEVGEDYRVGCEESEHTRTQDPNSSCNTRNTANSGTAANGSGKRSRQRRPTRCATRLDTHGSRCLHPPPAPPPSLTRTLRTAAAACAPSASPCSRPSPWTAW
jgi:hypothetical protein